MGNYSVDQIIGDCLTLFSIYLIDKKKFLTIEFISCLIPISSIQFLIIRKFSKHIFHNSERARVPEDMKC